MGDLKSEISDNFNVLNSGASVAGRLKNCLNYWFYVFKVMDFVLNIITCFLFIIRRILVVLQNSKSTIKHSSFVEEAITKLFKDECIEEVYSKL